MANPEHVLVLMQGTEVWNKWRKQNYETIVDLKSVDLSGRKLPEIDLSRADLANANLSHSDLSHSGFRGSDLINADLKKSNLSRADFSDANLRNADLRSSIMIVTIFLDTNLSQANWENATVGWCSFGNVDLGSIKKLEKVVSTGPSYIDFHTVIRSKNKIPVSFLRGAGIPEIFIAYLPSLMLEPFNFYSCFISYSSKDQGFAERLYADLQNKGVRCWFAPEDMKIGDKIRDRIDQSIRIHDKLLLILSENSINSEWVGDEGEAAYEQERQRGKTVLFPIRLDSAVMDTDKAWASKLRRSRHIGDFTQWKEHDAYQKAFERLMRDLKAEEPTGSE